MVSTTYQDHVLVVYRSTPNGSSCTCVLFGDCPGGGGCGLYKAIGGGGTRMTDARGGGARDGGVNDGVVPEKPDRV